MSAKALEATGLLASGEVVDGLVQVGESLSGLSVHEMAIVEQVVDFKYVDYVFFRRFSDPRSSEVCAYVVDNEKHQLSDSQLAELHQTLWLHGVAPLVYVATNTRIDILSCARQADFWDTAVDDRVYRPAEQIKLASQIDRELKQLQRFQAARLASGTFWDDPANSSLTNNKKAAHESLIQSIVDLDADLEGDKRPVMRRLLLLMVLIKYLEDRRVFPNRGWFGRYSGGARSFFDVLRAANPADVLRLLETLESRFNGDVFVLPQEVEVSLTVETLKKFASFVESRTLKQQRYLWDIHSFEHLPVEVISHLYNRFLTGKGQVYTPPFLASLILDYVMPYESLKGRERVLDPACGSGVFLVGAFRRLVNVWRQKNQWAEPDVESLKSILTHSIFGVEHSPIAVDLTAFSLALAVCDALKPNVIWRDLRLDPLRGANILEADFFDCVPASKDDSGTSKQPSHDLGKFDVIVGNPPFESKLTPAGNRVNKLAEKTRGTLPDKQTAYLFLEQALTLWKPKGRLCLLQPHGFLYNQNTHNFRSRIMQEATVDTVLDFVSIRHLFDGADPKSVAVLLRSDSPSDDNTTKHLTFRRTSLTCQRLGFELDHYDVHEVPQELVVGESLIWRINLLGGGRLWAIHAKFAGMRTIEEFTDEKGWLFREGFNIGNRASEAPFLTGMDFLPTSALTANGIDQSKITTVKETHFELPRPKELYQRPVMVIKEHLSLPCELWTLSDLSFRHEIVGVNAGSDSRGLKKFFATFNDRRDLYSFLCLLRSSRALMGKATAILKADIGALPYPEHDRELNFSFWEQAIAADLQSFLADYVRLGQNSELLKNAARWKDLAHSSSPCIVADMRWFSV